MPAKIILRNQCRLFGTGLRDGGRGGAGRRAGGRAPLGRPPDPRSVTNSLRGQ